MDRHWRDAKFSGDPDEAGRPWKLLRTARWILFPTVFLAGILCLAILPDVVKTFTPLVWPLPTEGASLQDIMPVHPETFSQAFALGHLTCQCTKEPPHCAEAALSQASNITGRPVSAKELLGVEAFLEELDAHKSVWQRVMGFLSFVHIMMLIGIVGILCTCLPCLAAICTPFLDVITKIVSNVIVPCLTWLHTIGFYEACAYVACYLIVVQGSQYPQGFSTNGQLVALGGALGFALCFVYSTKLWVDSDEGNFETFVSLIHALEIIVLTPLAYLLQSQLIGFFAAAALLGALGFSVTCFGLGFAIGFDSENGMHRAFIASFYVLLIFIILLVGGFLDSPYVAPFTLGIQILGTLCYSLALLIMSSRFHHYGEKYVPMNILMIFSLGAFALLGKVYGANALANTALTFLVLWLLEKQFELPWDGIGNIVPVFLSFVALVCASLWLSQHPGFILTMLSPITASNG